ncbi:MAG TPA: response regulator [Candidatus Dojkabacteria bacterium]|jgi:CheY-like chemotaxis protein
MGNLDMRATAEVLKIHKQEYDPASFPEYVRPDALREGAVHVIVADDENDIRNLVCFSATVNGFSEVTQAANGLEAMGTINASDAQTVIVSLDNVMPGMKGTHVIEQLIKGGAFDTEAQKTRRLRVFFASSQGTDAIETLREIPGIEQAMPFIAVATKPYEDAFAIGDIFKELQSREVAGAA